MEIMPRFTRALAGVLAALSLFGLTFGSDLPEGLSAPSYVLAAPQSWWDDVDLLSRVVMGEATGEPFAGQVAVAAVILNRTRSPEFPSTIAGVVYEIDAFESVSNGLIWAGSPTDAEYRAAELAINGWDPTGGALYFWNPATATSPWVWSRGIITEIGGHVFAR